MSVLVPSRPGGWALDLLNRSLACNCESDLPLTMSLVKRVANKAHGSWHASKTRHASFNFCVSFPHTDQTRKFQRYLVAPCLNQKNSRRLWRSQRRKSRSVPEGGADFPAAIFLAGKCPNLGRDSTLCCRKIGEEFSSRVKRCRKTFPARNFGQPQPSRVFLTKLFGRKGGLRMERKGMEEVLPRTSQRPADAHRQMCTIR